MAAAAAMVVVPPPPIALDPHQPGERPSLSFHAGSLACVSDELQGA